MRPRRDIGGCKSRQTRRMGILSGTAKHTCQRQGDGIMPRLIAQRAALPAQGQRRVDQPRAISGQVTITKVQTFQHAGAIILDHNIHRGRQLLQRRLCARVTQIKADGLLATRQHVPRPLMCAPGVIKSVPAENLRLLGQFARMFHPDHLGPLIGQQPGTVRPRQKPREIPERAILPRPSCRAPRMDGKQGAGQSAFVKDSTGFHLGAFGNL